jgi:hypothetical protein
VAAEVAFVGQGEAQRVLGDLMRPDADVDRVDLLGREVLDQAVLGVEQGGGDGGERGGVLAVPQAVLEAVEAGEARVVDTAGQAGGQAVDVPGSQSRRAAARSPLVTSSRRVVVAATRPGRAPITYFSYARVGGSMSFWVTGRIGSTGVRSDDVIVTVGPVNAASSSITQRKA